MDREGLLAAYLEVVASKYSPQALLYRIHAGISDEEAAMAVLVLAIAMVFTAEFINTSIEAVVDLATQEHHPLAKVGKDVGAAAVLIAALAAVLLALAAPGPGTGTPAGKTVRSCSASRRISAADRIGISSGIIRNLKRNLLHGCHNSWYRHLYRKLYREMHTKSNLARAENEVSRRTFYEQL